MTGHDPISAPEFQRGRLPVTPKGKTARRFLLIAAALSVLVHILAALTIMFLPRLLPREPRQQAQGTVELLMVEKKGDVASPPAQPLDSKQSPPRPEKKPPTPKEPPKEAPPKTPNAEKPSKPPPLPPIPDDKATEPSPPTEPPPPKEAKEDTKATPQEAPKDAAKETPKEEPAKESKDAAAVPPQPAAPPPQKAPVFDLSGTESESNATVMGAQVVPASQDDRYRNRPPIYPREAQMLREGGTVDLLIHVTNTGVTASVDVLSSSGHPVLDRAAIDAVLKWHFRPALREGRSVAFDLPFRFQFEPY